MEPAEILRAKIAYYRRRLAEGVDAEVAARYLQEIAKAEAELRHLESGEEAAAPAIDRRLEWTDAFSVGHPILDAEHRDLIRQISQLRAALDAKAAMAVKRPDLRALIHTARTHFEHEMTVLRDVAESAAASPRVMAIGENAIEDHVSAHNRALTELQAIVDKIGPAVADDLPRYADELIGWFLIHAMKYDASLKAVFQAM